MAHVRTPVLPLLLLFVIMPGTALHAGEFDDEDVLARAASHVARYKAELPYLVAEETASQRLTRQGTSGAPETRRLVSDFGWVQLDGISEPLGLREVKSVDWEPVGPLAQRARVLDGSRHATWREALELLNTGARFNLAPGSRNFNIPTFVFFFLLPDWQSRFSWKRESTSDARTWVFSFSERERPTAIRNAGKPVFSRGRVAVDPASGAVLHTELDLTIDKQTRYLLEVDFAHVPDVGLVLPTRMIERFGGDGVVVTGRATYANYRRFTTGARIVPARVQ